MQPTPKTPSDGAGRRRLLRAVPALTVLPATPVLAANCKLPSGFSVSGNLSRAGGNGCSAPAPLPGAWAGLTHSIGNNVFAYNGTAVRTDQGFDTLFPGGSSRSMAEVLADGSQNPDALFAAVRLQAIAAGGSPGFPSEQMVLDTWRDTRSGASYTPAPGVAWSRGDAVKYLLYLTGQSSA